MSVFRQISETAFILLMAAAAMLALYFLNDAANTYLDLLVRYGARGWQINGGRVLAIGGTALTELAATAVFAFIYARRGSDILAPVVFLWTFAALGAASALLLLWAARHADRADILWFVPMFVAAGILICAPGVTWVFRNAKRHRS